jgi:hypothetical protein
VLPPSATSAAEGGVHVPMLLLLIPVQRRRWHSGGM